MADATKPWWRSKAILLNALALLSLVIPAVADWVKNNPVEPLAALGAINVLVRFATKGKISVFPDDDDESGAGTTGMNAGGGSTGRSGGSAPGNHMVRRARFLSWLIVAACAATLFPSCTPASLAAIGSAWDAKAVITHVDPETGNSASVIIRPRRVVQEKRADGTSQQRDEFARRMRESLTWDPRHAHRPRAICHAEPCLVLP